MNIISFRTLITEREDWLMERILWYARTNGYVKFTSTLKEAWRLSISGLSAALLEGLQQEPLHLELGPEDTFVDDPMAAFGCLEARRHRERGVSLSMFLGLLKYYRESYKDMVRDAGYPPSSAALCLNLIERFFDRVEIAFCVEWVESDQSGLIEELQARNRLMTNEKNRYLTLFESHPHMVFILDKEHRILNMNHAAARHFRAQRTPGAHYYGAMSPGSAYTPPSQGQGASVCRTLEALLGSLTDDLRSFAASEAMHLTFEKSCKEDDEMRHFLVILSRVLDVSAQEGGRVLDVSAQEGGIVLVIEDITAQKQITEDLRLAKEAADAANQAKSEFLANMSHELRTPLTAILGYSQLMQRSAFHTPEHREYVQTINRSGEHLLALINDILDISKIEARCLSLDFRTIDLDAVLRDLYGMFKVKTDGKGLSFALDLARDIPRYVVTDANKFRQVLINLLGNAVKFTDTGGIVLRVVMKEASPEKICLRVEVEDTGPGIAEEERDKVFQVFEQTAAGKRHQEGTGLGMAISREYTRMMGGELTFTSRPGAGSTFRVEIHVRRGEASDMREKGRHQQVIGLVPGQPVPRVLVTEDNTVNRLLLVKLLTQVGFDVHEVENGAQAVEMCRQWVPQFVWMDIRMPVMDGLEAAKRIKAAPGGETIKIVALTASALAEERASILAAGYDDFVPKPYREADIFLIMAEQLGIVYEYEDGEPADSGGPNTQLGCRDLVHLPTDLRAALLNAVLELDTARILAVVAIIEQQDGVIGPILRTLAENLEYQRLLALLEGDNTDVEEM